MVQFEALTENLTCLWGFKQTPRATKLYYFTLARINTLINLFSNMIKSQNYKGFFLKEDLTTLPRLETLPEPAALHLSRKGDEVCLRSESPKVLLFIQILTESNLVRHNFHGIFVIIWHLQQLVRSEGYEFPLHNPPESQYQSES